MVGLLIAIESLEFNLFIITCHGFCLLFLASVIKWQMFVCFAVVVYNYFMTFLVPEKGKLSGQFSYCHLIPSVMTLNKARSPIHIILTEWTFLLSHSFIINLYLDQNFSEGVHFYLVACLFLYVGAIQLSKISCKSQKQWFLQPRAGCLHMVLWWCQNKPNMRLPNVRADFRFQHLLNAGL